jgi:hypothetical protein
MGRSTRPQRTEVCTAHDRVLRYPGALVQGHRGGLEEGSQVRTLLVLFSRYLPGRSPTTWKKVGA